MKKIMKKLLILVFFLIVFLQSGFTSQLTVEQTLQKLINLFKSFQRPGQGQALTKTQIEKNIMIAMQIREIFDYDTFIQEAMVDHLNQLSEQQKSDIFNKFKNLIELIAYPQGSYFYNNSENTFHQTQLDNGKATIPSSNYNNDKDIEVSMDYVFKKIESNWVVVDLLLNGHSLIDAYRLQINRIVSKKGIGGLIKVLNEKYTELTGVKP